MADELAVREEYRLQEWAKIHRRCKESGTTNREFCRQNGISEKTFYYWHKKLREAAIDSEPQLSNGRFQWPRSTEELKSVDAQSFRWLMEGLKIEQPKAIRRGEQKALF